MKQSSTITRQSLLNKFGVKQTGTYRGPLHQVYLTDLQAAIESRAQIGLVAQFGAGKTDLIGQLKMSYHGKKKRPLFIDIVSPDKQRLTVTSVIDAMLRGLNIKERGRSTEAKATNLITGLGRFMRDHERPVCLTIDNAHRCREELFSELRDLREQDFDGIKPLFSVLLIGQEGLEGKLNERPEVGWRTQFLFMTEQRGWWSFNERVAYLNAVYGKVITPGARKNIAAKTHAPLEMDVCVADAFERASASGVKTLIDEEVVPATLKEQREAQGLSLQDVADQAGISKTSVSNAERNEMDGSANPEHKSRIQQALQESRQQNEDHIQSKSA